MLDELFSYIMRSLTANNVKWFLRIIIKDLKLRMGTNRILCCYHPDAPEHYNICGKLSKVTSSIDTNSRKNLYRRCRSDEEESFLMLS